MSSISVIAVGLKANSFGNWYVAFNDFVTHDAEILESNIYSLYTLTAVLLLFLPRQCPSCQKEAYDFSNHYLNLQRYHSCVSYTTRI